MLFRTFWDAFLLCLYPKGDVYKDQYKPHLLEEAFRMNTYLPTYIKNQTYLYECEYVGIYVYP